VEKHRARQGKPKEVHTREKRGRGAAGGKTNFAIFTRRVRNESISRTKLLLKESFHHKKCRAVYRPDSTAGLGDKLNTQGERRGDQNQASNRYFFPVKGGLGTGLLPKSTAPILGKEKGAGTGGKAEAAAPLWK